MSANDLFDELPSLARLAFGAYWRTAEYAVRQSLDITRGLLGSLGVDLPQPRPPAPPPAAAEPDEPAAASPTSLRERGEELLRRSADVREDNDEHPAYERILDDLLPDEARVLRLLATGPQPAVDVRAGALPLNATSELVALGLTMIGAEAGCRRPERIPAYLNNLERLGLIWFSREAVPEQSRYQVLEAQPDVVEALRSRPRSRTVRRSIALTPFGADFCERVLPPTTAEFAAVRAP